MSEMIARWVGAVVLGVTLAVAAAGCGPSDPPPVIAARAYARALQARDVKALLALVEARAVERVAQAGERAGDQIGGRRTIELHEMLQIVDVDPRFEVASATLAESSEATARVVLTAVDGREHSIDLVNEDGAWRVKMPLPANPSET